MERGGWVLRSRARESLHFRRKRETMNEPSSAAGCTTRTPEGVQGVTTRRSVKGRRVSAIGVMLSLLAAVTVLLLVPGAAFGAGGNQSANLDQCANGSDLATRTSGCNADASDWVNGNLGASKSAYQEGDSIPYRMRFDNLTPGATIHHVTIEWDTTKSSKHAIDFLTTYNRTVADANPCLGVSGCTGSGSTTNGAIPTDPQVAAGISAPGQGAGTFTIWGGSITSLTRPAKVGNTTCTNANSAGSYCYSTGTGYTSDKSAAITVNFTASVANPVLAWGGHIAQRRPDTPTPSFAGGWGDGNAAVNISGSPYHMRLIDLDGAGGNQDRSLSSEAVTFPGFIHIVKNTTGGDATFGYTASPSPLTNFNLTTVSGTAEKDFDNITNFTTYTVNESTIPLHWSFVSLACSVATGTDNGGSQTVNGTQATIVLKEGEDVTCTYTNQHTTNTPSVSTTLSDAGPISIGTSVHDSATITGATADAGGTITYKIYSDNTCSTLVADVTPSPNTVSAGVAPDSSSHQFNSAGTFYWQATYSGDSNNTGPVSSVCTSETLVVGPNTPSVSTTLSDAGPISIGTSVHDSATITGATADAGGTITYKIYSDNTCSTVVADVTPSPNTVSAGVAPDSSSHQFNSAGTFYWQATYSGDSNNTGPVSSTCTSEVVTVTSAAQHGATPGFWQSQNGHAIITSEGLLPVTLGSTASGKRSILVTSLTISDTVMKKNTCSLTSSNLFPACTGPSPAGFSDSLQKGTFETLAAQTLALVYNQAHFSGFGSQTVSALGCTVPTALNPPLSGSSTLSQVLQVAEDLIANSTKTGTTTQAQASGMNSLLGCINTI
jgi:hypothetical protein